MTEGTDVLKVPVQLLTGREIVTEVTKTATILDVKEYIHRNTGEQTTSEHHFSTFPH